MENSSSKPNLWLYYSPYVLPFAIFAILTIAPAYLDLNKGLVYSLKTVLTGLCLAWAWKALRNEIHFVFSWTAIISGVLVFFIWIGMDSLYPHIGHSEFNPFQEASGNAVYAIIAFRLIGACLVVPVMEEVFWRSFALRFLIKSDFKSVPLGKFSWYSFIIITLLFGFEHHEWLSGIVSGIIYAGILYQSKNLFVPILSHAITNLLLGIYVIYTQQWSFW